MNQRVGRKMSEYIRVDVEALDDPNSMKLITNLNLTPGGPESYANRDEGDEGSPLAQTLFAINGLAALDMDSGIMILQRDPSADIEWPALIDEITTALKDFFL
jgi:hypothetical protein